MTKPCGELRNRTPTLSRPIPGFEAGGRSFQPELSQYWDRGSEPARPIPIPGSSPVRLVLRLSAHLAWDPRVELGSVRFWRPDSHHAIPTEQDRAGTTGRISRPCRQTFSAGALKLVCSRSSGRPRPCPEEKAQARSGSSFSCRLRHPRLRTQPRSGPCTRAVPGPSGCPSRSAWPEPP